MFLTENWVAQIGRGLVSSADLWYNGMVMKMDEPKKRKTTRLKGADYNRNQAVFLTICTKERRCVLSRIVGTGVLDGPQIELTKYGQIADKYLRQLNDFYDDLSVESYVIMPNHIHIMLWVKGAGNGPSRTPVPTMCERIHFLSFVHIVRNTA